MEQQTASGGSVSLTSAPAPAGWNIAFAGSRGPAGDAQRTTCGQVLGPTFDYTHRLIDFTLEQAAEQSPEAESSAVEANASPRVADLRNSQP